MTEIVWSDTALKTYLSIIDYLFLEWTQKEIDTFQADVEALLVRIALNNYLCKASDFALQKMYCKQTHCAHLCR